MNARVPAAIMVLLLLAGWARLAGAEDGPFVVFISLDSGDHGPGEVVNFTVYTFGRGEAAAPDGPPSVTIDSGISPGRPVPITAAGIGVWSGSYTVLSADADRFGQISLEARAYFSAMGGRDGAYTGGAVLRLADRPTAPAEGGVSIRAFVLECPDGAVKAGSSVTFSACATRDGDPVPPGDIRFWVAYDSDADIGDREAAEARENGPGAFLVHYTIPAKAQSGRFLLGATCLGTEYGYLASVRLDFLNVIYHELGRNGSAIEYELLVSDRAGSPVNGSDVRATVASYFWGVGPVELELGKTDQNGRLRGVADAGSGVGEFRIHGWANTSKYSQSFFGTVRLSNDPQPETYLGDRFYIHRLSPLDNLPAGPTTLYFRAYFQGEPVRRQALDCYVNVYLGVYQTGAPVSVSGQRPVTGDDGTFFVNLTVPEAAGSWAHVTCVGPGTPYSSSYYSYTDILTLAAPPASPPASWANATFSGASPGRAVRISSGAPAGSLAAASARWDFASDGSDPARPWMVLGTFTWYMPARHADGSPIRGQMILPGHLKTGQNLTVTVSFVNASGAKSSAGFPLRVRAAAAEEPPADTCCITSIFVVNALLIALLFINYRATRRGERGRKLVEMGADEQVEAVLRGARAPRGDLTLPIKVELAQSEDCTACGRKIARGSLAWRCVCGARYHEHCTGDGMKCPSCGRGWTKR